jgi:hypothetical protein
VIEGHQQELADLTVAAGSTLGFWDHPLDGEDWNEPVAG